MSSLPIKKCVFQCSYPVRLYPSAFASICVFVHFVGTCGGPPEVQKSDPFGAGTSVPALRCNKCMAVLIGVFRGQPPLPGPLHQDGFVPCARCFRKSE